MHLRKQGAYHGARGIVLTDNKTDSISPSSENKNAFGTFNTDNHGY